jgi:predicted metal-binding protein
MNESTPVLISSYILRAAETERTSFKSYVFVSVVTICLCTRCRGNLFTLAT